MLFCGVATCSDRLGPKLRAGHNDVLGAVQVVYGCLLDQGGDAVPKQDKEKVREKKVHNIIFICIRTMCASKRVRIS